MTADDVLWTIAWSAQNPDAFKQIPVSAYLEVKGAAEVKGTTNTPDGAEKIDDHTVKLTLAAPDSTFLRRIAGAVYYILPKHILDGLTAAQAETCPFCLGHRRRDDRLRPVRLLRVDLGRWRDVQGQEGLLEGQGLADRHPRLQDPGVERVGRPARRG